VETYEWCLVRPLIESAFQTSRASLSNELSNDESKVHGSSKDTSQSQWANLRGICRRDDNVETISQATQNLPSTQHPNRRREELHEDKNNRPDATNRQSDSSSESLKRPTASESSKDLSNRVAHAKTRLPWRGDDPLAFIQLSEPLLEGGERIEGGDELGIETGHDDCDAEEHCPEDGGGVLLDGSPEAEVVFCGGDVSRGVNLEKSALLHVGVCLVDIVAGGDIVFGGTHDCYGPVVWLRDGDEVGRALRRSTSI
jgi:hypothetical protein